MAIRPLLTLRPTINLSVTPPLFRSFRIGNSNRIGAKLVTCWQFGQEQDMLVTRTPASLRTVGRRIKLVPNKVVPHGPADIIGYDRDSMRYKLQSLPFERVANDNETRTGLISYPEQML